MKKLLMSSVLAVSSVFAVTACTSVNATTDTAPVTHMQKQHQGGMNKGGMRGPMSQLNLTAAQQTKIQGIMQQNNNNHMQKHNSVMEVLTAEQRQTLAKLKAERKTKGHHGSDKRSNMMGAMSQLNLTAAQQTKIQAIRQNNRDNRMQQHEAVMEVLTVEQREKLNKLRSEMKNKHQQGAEHRGMHHGKQRQGM